MKAMLLQHIIMENDEAHKALRDDLRNIVISIHNLERKMKELEQILAGLESK